MVILTAMLEKTESKEQIDFLHAVDLKKSTTVTILEVKGITKTKFGDKLFATVEIHDKTPKTWVINNKSKNYLIDTLGADETKWNGQKVELEIVKMGTPSGLKDVIYAKGAV